MKKPLFFISLILSCFVLAQIQPITFDIVFQAANTGPSADGHNLYLGCEDLPNKILIGSVAEGQSNIALSVDITQTLNFCATSFITDALGNDNEGPLIMAAPLDLSQEIVSIPDAPIQLDIQISCNQLPTGLVCAGTVSP